MALIFQKDIFTKEKGKVGNVPPTISEQLEKIYAERGANMDDYYVPPLVVVGPDGEPVAKVKKGDVVFFPNHRSDRAREALRALTDPDFNKRGNRFDTENLGVWFVPFNVYDKEYFETHGIQSAFVSEFTLPPYKSIIEILHQAGVMQGYFTESDKGQHVTHFFAGQRDLDYPALGIEVSVIPSEGVKDEKKDPRMKYEQITDNVINYLNKNKDISKKKVIVVNLPVDIQGHNIKGNKERAIKTILAADEATGRIREAIRSQKGVYIETADHGNIEKLATLDENGIPLSDKYGVIPFDEHTDNPVNFIIDGLGRNLKFKEGKGLSNIAATLLEILGIPKPKEMEESLLSDYQYQEIEGPIVLVIRDGWGVNKFKNKEAKENDGIELAQPPVFLDLLKNCPHTILKAHGDAVGLPDYQMGDSDNGHRVIGTGYNPPTLYKQIIEQIENGSFFQNPVLLQAFELAEKEKRDIHIMGLYSSGGIHSDNRFSLALMEMAKKVNFSGKVNIWPILDGRDVMTRVPTENGIFYLNQIQAKIAELNFPNIQLAGTIGRNFAMDRDGINVDISADKKEKLAETKTGEEADKLRIEAAKIRGENKKIWEERFKVAYKLWVNGEGTPVRLDSQSAENKISADRAEAESIMANPELKIKEFSELLNFLDAHAGIFKKIGGGAFSEFLGEVKDVLEKYSSLAENNLTLVVHTSFLKTGGAVDVLNAVRALNPFIKLCFYGEGVDKVSALFGNDEDILSGMKLDEVLLKLIKADERMIIKGEEIVLLKPGGEKADLGRDWEGIRQVGFSETGISSVDIAKALEVLTGKLGEVLWRDEIIVLPQKEYETISEELPPVQKAFREFYGKLKSEQLGVISGTTYEKTKDAVFAEPELKTGILDLPSIELIPKVSEGISKDLETVLKFTEKYL